MHHRKLKYDVSEKIDKRAYVSYNTNVHEKNELLNYGLPAVGGVYAFVFCRASLVHQEVLFLFIGGIMDITVIRKAIALIARGIVEKEQLLEKQPNRYPHSKKLQHGINMFLYASLEWGGVGESIFEFADESKFLNKYARIPVAQWFDEWNLEVCSRLDLENQPFYGYDAFAYYRKRTNRYMPSEDCAVFLETQEANIIEGTDEYALYEKIIRLSQADYCLVRKFIIEHPIMTIDERRDILVQLADNMVAKEAINVAYELFQETGYRCPVCGWTMVVGNFGPICHSEYCIKTIPMLTDAMKVDGTEETIYRLKKGIMRYFAQPGKLELDIVAFCEKQKLIWELWPQKDTYDVEITFPDGAVWEIDAKAYRNPIALRSKIETDNGMPEGEYQRGYFVIPTDFVKGNRQYTTIVNKALDTLHQPNVRCITMHQLKENINRKVEKCRAKNRM